MDADRAAGSPPDGLGRPAASAGDTASRDAAGTGTDRDAEASLAAASAPAATAAAAGRRRAPADARRDMRAVAAAARLGEGAPRRAAQPSAVPPDAGPRLLVVRESRL